MKSIDKTIVKNKQEIKYRELDIFGMPKNCEYNKREKEREKYIEEAGEVIFEINIGVNPQEKILPNLDFQIDEMTPEQKEVYDALEFNEDGYEKLEEDFCLNNFCGEDDLKILEKDVQKLEGDQIERNEFLKIIEEDAKFLNIDFQNEDYSKSNDRENIEGNKKNTVDEIKKKKKLLEEQKRKLEEQIKHLDFQIQKEEVPFEEDEFIDDYIQDDTEEKKLDLGKNNPGDKLEEEMTPDEILRQKIINKIPRKGEIILEENVLNAEGGGTIIFRKIKKVKEPVKKKYEIVEIKHEDVDYYKKKPENEKNSEIDGLDEESYSLDLDDESPLDENEIAILKKNYENIQKEKNLQNDNEGDDGMVFFRKEKKIARDHISDNEIEEEKEFDDGLEVIKKYSKFKRTPFQIEKDSKIKEMGIVDDDEYENVEVEDRPVYKKLIEEECETAPEKEVIHENYYCMQVIEEDLQVVPRKLKKDVRKIKPKQAEHDKPDLTVLVRNKNETKEEKKNRKEIIKNLKEERKNKKREKKMVLNEIKKQSIKEKNCQKIGNPLLGISVHKLI